MHVSLGAAVPRTDVPPPPKTQSPKREPITVLSYWQVHHRLRTERGKASDHLCQCGRPAKDWAYLRGSTGIRSASGTGVGCWYSENIWDDYAPMCRSCHQRLDVPEGPKHLHTPEARARNVAAMRASTSKRGSAKTNAMRLRCLECDLVTSPGPMTLHLKKRNHRGAETL